MVKDNEILLKYNGKTAGELLREARDSRGLSIEQIEGALKIKAKHVEAIEFDDHDELPGRVYAIGFIRTYSEYMGFDPDEMVALFKMTSIGRHTSVGLSSHGDVVTVSQTPSRLLIAFCVLGLCFSGIMFGKSKKFEETGVNGVEQSAIPDVPQSLVRDLDQAVTIAYTEKEHGAIEKTRPSVNPDVVVASAVDSIEKTETVEVRAIYDSWINVKNAKGASVYAGILQMGNTYQVPEGSGYTLMTGNAGGTEIVINGKSDGVLGEVSQVRKGVSLDVR